LTARWVDLLLVTYPIPDRLLEPRLPPGCSLDRYQGAALGSLVAFDFVDTKVGGIAWPGFTDFPELNLRFYVRGPDGARGVCFIREYVPSRLVAWIARGLYNEPYRAVPYRKDGAAHLLAVGGREHRIAWHSDGEPFVPEDSSLAHFLKEHQLGFGVDRRGARTTYRVEHPVWRIWPRVEPRLEVDFALLYGEEWRFLGDLEPLSVVHAEGSAIAVHPLD
jgi:hypothetical protein